ncbi:hypothetical protein EB061_11075 [bacterium]|nr:hypothetical protein [bacterium]
MKQDFRNRDAGSVRKEVINAVSPGNLGGVLKQMMGRTPEGDGRAPKGVGQLGFPVKGNREIRQKQALVRGADGDLRIPRNLHRSLPDRLFLEVEEQTLELD